MTADALRAFFDSQGLELLPSNRYRPKGLSEANVERTLYYRRNRREFQALAKRFSAFLSGSDGIRPAADPPELEVRHIGGLLGRGLFAGQDISEGALIGEYTGIVRPSRPGKPLPGGGFTSDYAWGFPQVRTLGRSLEIDAGEAGGILRFANHSEHPLAYPDHFALKGQWRIIFVAVRDITAGEEITVDYGEAYWSGGDRELAQDSESVE